MFCYVLSECFDQLCYLVTEMYALLYHVMLCYVSTEYWISYAVTDRYALLHHVMISYVVTDHCALLYHVLLS